MRKLLLLLFLFSLSCTKVYNQLPTEPSDSAKTSGLDIIEYRVTGTATSVSIRYSNSSDGLTQVTTSLPYSVTIQSDKKVIFLSLDAQVLLFTSLQPFMSAQIYVNGQLFREATATNFSTPLSIAATFRH